MFKQFFQYKRGVSPVIATIFLIAATIIIAVTVYQFLQDYSQNTKELVANNALLNDLQIRVIDANEDRGYIQTPYDNLNVTRVLLDGVECSNNSGIAPSKTLKLNLSSCSGNVSSSKPQLIIETNEGIIQKQIRELGATPNSVSSSFHCSDLPGNWTSVPGNAYFSTSNFCVMQFEAKDVGGVARSQSSLTPWVNIDFADASSECDQLNTEHSSFSGTFKMITDNEWMTIARDIEQNSNNWADGVIGSTVSSGGGLFRGNGNLSDSVTCGSGTILSADTSGVDCVISGGTFDGRNKRVLILSNGERIWDLSGNAWQYTDLIGDGTNIAGDQACSFSSNAWFSYYNNDGQSECSWRNGYNKSGATDVRYEMGPLGNYNANNGVGRIKDLTPGGNWVIYRGGHFRDNSNTGVFASSLYPSGENFFGGFRCSYTP